MNLYRQIKIFTRSLLDFIYPPSCMHCDMLMPKHSLLCDECMNRLQPIGYAECAACKAPLLQNQDICPKHPKPTDEEPIVFYRSLGIFNGVLKTLIHGLKYRDRTDIGIYFGHLIGKLIDRERRFRDFELLVPVPIHKIRKRDRGYNQSEMIARGITERCGMPSNSKAVRRVRNTQSQTKLDLKNRQENVRNVFEVVDKDVISGKGIIIVDDVVTTGATTKELARALIAAGAKKICVACVARPTEQQSKENEL